MQGLERLGPVERTGSSTVEEAWAAQASHYQNGAGGHVVLGSDSGHGYEARSY